jgi:N-carbamoyl-L-amino-acid hydrolase
VSGVGDPDALAPEKSRIAADLAELSGFADPDEAGWTRRVFSEPYRASRAWVRARMRDAGLDVCEDDAGNLIGLLPGTTGAPALVTGSHTDTVSRGGRFDGVVGVLGAIEFARRLRETGMRLAHDLLVVDFLGEEPNAHGVSCIGSRAIAGLISPGYLDQRDGNGVTLGRALESAGRSPSDMLRARWRPDDVAAFVELHIEQGPVLQRRQADIGVVTAIAGIERVMAAFTGRADHAGTMPMTDRRDALAAAAQAILTVEQIGCGEPDAVATVGDLKTAPGALNIVPESARIWAELRSPSQAWLGTARKRVVQDIADLAQARGVEVELDWLNDQDPVPTTLGVQDVIAAASQSLGQRWTSIVSGAGHDAAHLAALAPMGMIFVPSRDGRSHCPEEWTDLDQIGAGVHALAATMVSLDGNPHLGALAS